MTCHRCFLPSFGSFGQLVAEKKIILKLTNQQQELNKAAMLGNASGRYEQAKWFQRRN
jgi:hypothetical protein